MSLALGPRVSPAGGEQVPGQLLLQDQGWGSRSDLRSPGKISKLGGFRAPDGDSTRVILVPRPGTEHGPRAVKAQS